MQYNHTSEVARKYHFWRGFRSAGIVFVPVIVLLLVLCNQVLDAVIH